MKGEGQKRAFMYIYRASHNNNNKTMGLATHLHTTRVNFSHQTATNKQINSDTYCLMKKQKNKIMSLHCLQYQKTPLLLILKQESIQTTSKLKHSCKRQSKNSIESRLNDAVIGFHWKCCNLINKRLTCCVRRNKLRIPRSFYGQSHQRIYNRLEQETYHSEVRDDGTRCQRGSWGAFHTNLTCNQYYRQDTVLHLTLKKSPTRREDRVHNPKLEHSKETILLTTELLRLAWDRRPRRLGL